MERLVSMGSLVSISILETFYFGRSINRGSKSRSFFLDYKLKGEIIHGE